MVLFIHQKKKKKKSMVSFSFHPKDVNPFGIFDIWTRRMRFCMLGGRGCNLGLSLLAKTVVKIESIAGRIIVESELLFFTILDCFLQCCSHSPKQIPALLPTVSINPYKASNQTHIRTYRLQKNIFFFFFFFSGERQRDRERS